MKQFLKNKMTSLALVAGLTLSLGGIALASSGGAGDPLVSLSYLEEIVTPAMEAEAISQAEIAVSVAEMELKEDIADLKSDLTHGNVSGASEFVIITLGNGESVTLDSGAQAVLRVGVATVSSSDNQALVDLSNGTNLNTGGSLALNHLYLATDLGRVITAQEQTVKIMVSGGYALH